MIKDAADVIGIVTVHDGPSLPAGQISTPRNASADAIRKRIEGDMKR